jgi:hypothetical protein
MLQAYPGENDNIRLQPHDKFGFTTDRKSVLAFKFGRYAWTLQAKMRAIPVIGGLHDINVRFHPYNISLFVVVATQKEWCKYGSSRGNTMCPFKNSPIDLPGKELVGISLNYSS